MEHPIRVATEPKVITSAPIPPRQLNPDTQKAWQWAGRFALLLTLAALSDWIIAWIPFNLGNLEWEFGTITATLASLPLVTIGLAGMLSAALARGRTAQVIAIACVLILFGVLIGAALAIFMLDVPVALQSVQGVAHLGIQKATAKNLSMGLIFMAGYFVAGIVGLKHALGHRSR
jgi:hypothetical protein